jgi:hypothetical protein
VLDRLHLPVAHDEVCITPQDRRDQLGDVRGGVLVVRVRVDDHVRPQLQRGVQPGLEALCESLVVGEPHDMVDAVRPRDLDRRVCGAVVDDEPLDRVEALDLARQVRKRDGERLLLVEAGDLDDELHRVDRLN